MENLAPVKRGKFTKFKDKVLEMLGQDKNQMSDADMEKAIGEQTIKKILA